MFQRSTKFITPLFILIILIFRASSSSVQARPLPTDTVFSANSPTTNDILVLVRVNAGINLAPYFISHIVRPYIDSNGHQAIVGETTEANLIRLQNLPTVHQVKRLDHANQVTIPSDPDLAYPPLSSAELEKRLDALQNQPRNLRSIPPKPTFSDQRGWWDAETGHNFRAAWANGYTGTGVQAMINDSGVDFCHPDLIGTWAIDNNPASPHLGYPLMFDSYSMYLYALDVAEGSTHVADGEADYADTSTVCSLGNCSYQPIGATSSYSYTLPATSISGNYRIGTHPDATFGNDLRRTSGDFTDR